MIIQSCDEIQTQSKAPAAVTIAFGKNAEDFQRSNDVFDFNAQASQVAVTGALIVRQRMVFSRFDERNHAI
jgi:hypothetical protein